MPLTWLCQWRLRTQADTFVRQGHEEYAYLRWLSIGRTTCDKPQCCVSRHKRQSSLQMYAWWSAGVSQWSAGPAAQIQTPLSNLRRTNASQRTLRSVLSTYSTACPARSVASAALTPPCRHLSCDCRTGGHWRTAPSSTADAAPHGNCAFAHGSPRWAKLSSVGVITIRQLAHQQRGLLAYAMARRCRVHCWATPQRGAMGGCARERRASG